MDVSRPSLLTKALLRGWEHLHFIDDETYLRFRYRCIFSKPLNLDNPRSFNEKLQWLKLYDRNPIYTTLVDKWAVKDWVRKKIGPEYVTPTFAMWDTVDRIDISDLPQRFVLKTNHDCGGIAICRDRDSFDFEAAKKKLNKHIRKNYYWHEREWPYKNVAPCVFAEEYLEDLEYGDVADYKFFCFAGEAKAMFIATERNSESETKFDFFDMDFNHLPLINGHPNSSAVLKKPDLFDEMKQLAETLSEGIPHVRVDFYETGGGIRFGEMTFSHWGGSVKFEPSEWDYTFGSWLELPTQQRKTVI